jgi:hypothetical protein
MNNRILTIFMAILVMLSICQAQTSFMHVNNKDGSKTTYDIKDINKMTFDPATDYKTMNIEKKTGGTDLVTLPETKNLTFTVNSTGFNAGQSRARPKQYILHQNYPNPFNPVTTIAYDLPRSGQVEIKIIDVTGRLLRALFSGQQTAGSHSQVWDGRNEAGELCSSGLYICQAKFEKATLVKKIMFVK